MGYIGYERCLLPGSTGPGAFSTPGRHQVRVGLYGHSWGHGSNEVSCLRTLDSIYYLRNNALDFTRIIDIYKYCCNDIILIIRYSHNSNNEFFLYVIYREKLAAVFSFVQEVNVLDSEDEANLALLSRPELGITFTKLHCWRLTQYEKCVFVDADTLVSNTENCI